MVRSKSSTGPRISLSFPKENILPLRNLKMCTFSPDGFSKLGFMETPFVISAFYSLLLIQIKQQPMQLRKVLLLRTRRMK